MSKWMVAAMVAAVLVAGVAIAEEPAAAPAMQDVESTLIKEVGYDAATQVLTVVFETTNETYEYKNVPESLYKELMAAESKGAFFAANIKGKFEFTKK
jgi:hypothetical protein